MVVGGGVSASHDWSWIDLGIENVLYDTAVMTEPTTEELLYCFMMDASNYSDAIIAIESVNPDILRAQSP